MERSEVGEGLPELEDVVVCERIGEAERKRSDYVHVGGERTQYSRRDRATATLYVCQRQEERSEASNTHHKVERLQARLQAAQQTREEVQHYAGGRVYRQALKVAELGQNFDVFFRTTRVVDREVSENGELEQQWKNVAENMFVVQLRCQNDRVQVWPTFYRRLELRGESVERWRA